MTDADYADDLALLAYRTTQVESLLGLYINVNETEFM